MVLECLSCDEVSRVNWYGYTNYHIFLTQLFVIIQTLALGVYAEGGSGGDSSSKALDREIGVPEGFLELTN